MNDLVSGTGKYLSLGWVLFFTSTSLDKIEGKKMDAALCLQDQPEMIIPSCRMEWGRRGYCVTAIAREEEAHTKTDL